MLPSLLGLTIGLKLISEILESSLLSTNSHSGVKILFFFARIFVKFLSKQCSEDIESDPLYFILFCSKIFCMDPSSPNVPWSAKKIKSNFWLRIDSSKPSKPWTLYPNFSQALMIALPELIDTSLSEESPPYMTPILMISPLLHVINHLQSN